MSDPEVTDNQDQHRFEILVDGNLAGFSEYHLHPDRIAFTHTEIDKAFSGQGLASKLVRSTLDDARSRNLLVLPYCPFVQDYIAKHPPYVALVAADQRADFGLDGDDASP